MIIRTSPASPFGRKVRIAALHLNLPFEVAATDFLDPNDPLRAENPLGKMPVLTTDSGEHVFDSPVILGYLDHLAGGGLILPVDPAERIAVRQVEALCDGVLDAGVAIIMENRMRPEEKWHAPWIEHQRGKADRGLAALARADISAERVDVASISLACTLAWLDFRQPTQWRDVHPGLIEWLDRFDAQVPAFALTAPPAA